MSEPKNALDPKWWDVPASRKDVWVATWVVLVFVIWGAKGC